MFLRKFTFIIVAVMLCGYVLKTEAQTTSVFTTGLSQPSKVILSPSGNLLVTETMPMPNSGRVSIIDRHGNRRTLIDGLPSGMDPDGLSGPQGLDMQGFTLFVAIGNGDGTLAGPIQGTEIPNFHPSSPILSSVMTFHFSTNVEMKTQGFSLTLADHVTLANGGSVTLSDGSGNTMFVGLLADFPNYVPDPIPPFPANVRHSNPFGLGVSGGDVYVADGGMNNVVKVNIATRNTQIVTTFPPRVNPLPFGPPVIDAVPDGIRIIRGELFVPLLTGFPFVVGLSEVRRVDLATGNSTTFIGGRSSAIDIVEGNTFHSPTQYYVLEFSSDFLVDAPGQLLSFSSPMASPTVVAGGLISPSGMVRDAATGDIYITEIFTGNILRVSFP